MALVAKIGNVDVPYEECVETEEFWNNASRRTLTFRCPFDAIGIADLNTLLNDEHNTEQINLVNEDEGIVKIYDLYQLKISIGIEPYTVIPEDPSQPATHVDKIVFKLGRRTYIEQRLHDLGLD